MRAYFFSTFLFLFLFVFKKATTPPSPCLFPRANAHHHAQHGSRIVSLVSLCCWHSTKNYYLRSSLISLLVTFSLIPQHQFLSTHSYTPRHPSDLQSKCRIEYMLDRMSVGSNIIGSDERRIEWMSDELDVGSDDCRIE